MPKKPRKRQPQPDADEPRMPPQQMDLFMDMVRHIDRPIVRGDCTAVPRPCPFVSCRYNMNLDVMSTGGLRWRQSSDFEPGSRQNCALDLADKGPFTLDEIGKVMGVSRERIRQEVKEAFRKMRDCLPEPMYSDLLEHIDVDEV